MKYIEKYIARYYCDKCNHYHYLRYSSKENSVYRKHYGMKR